MAHYCAEPSHTFSEYLLIPGYTSEDCIPANVSLRTPLVKYRKGQEEPAMSLNIPMVSAIMQSVSNDTMAIALAREGGLSFIYCSQSIENEAAMVARVKAFKAGFVVSASNLTPEATLQDVLNLKAQNGFSTVAVTDDGTATGKLLGIVTSRDYRISRMDPSEKVSSFMTPREKLVTAPAETILKEANDIIWANKLNSLPIVDANGHLLYFVFRKDYSSHKDNPLELLDSHKRYLVGAGINSRDYAQRVPALVEAGADVLCIDSSERTCARPPLMFSCCASSASSPRANASGSSIEVPSFTLGFIPVFALRNIFPHRCAPYVCRRNSAPRRKTAHAVAARCFSPNPYAPRPGKPYGPLSYDGLRRRSVAACASYAA